MGSLEYKDVEAKSEIEAYKHKTDAVGFKATDSGYILETYIDDNLGIEMRLGEIRNKFREKDDDQRKSN